MIFEISDFWIGLISGGIIMFAIVVIIGLLVGPKNKNEDKYHPLNKKQ